MVDLYFFLGSSEDLVFFLGGGRTVSLPEEVSESLVLELLGLVEDDGLTLVEDRLVVEVLSLVEDRLVVEVLAAAFSSCAFLCSLFFCLSFSWSLAAFALAETFCSRVDVRGILL